MRESATSYNNNNNNNKKKSHSSSINLFLGGLGSTPRSVWAHVCRIYLPISFIHLAINKLINNTTNKNKQISC